MSNTIDYGIDLGTTNSCIAKWENGIIKVFQNNDQMNVTPSAVHILKTGRVIVGRRGLSAILTDPENVAIEFKRWMGHKDRKTFPSAEREYSPEELSAEILKSLREDVRRQTGMEISTAVITVPAAFGALQCEATARAAEIAGLEEAPLLQEPIAAAIGYGAHPGGGNQRWLVFDLGGGTLDIAVVSTREDRLNILEHRGNNLLGGKDIDRSIVENIFLPVLESSYDLRVLGQDAARNALYPKLRMKAEEAKIDLSTEIQVVVSLYDIGNDDSGHPIEIEIPLTRKQLEQLMNPLLDKCFVLAQDALSGARMTTADLDRILLVGGPTQSPILRSELSTRLGVPIDFSADPMTVVGRGAALYASTLEKAKKTQTTKKQECLHLLLAYEPVSSELECSVSGRVIETQIPIEIKIDVDGGLWTSGWIKLKNGLFDTTVSLKEGDITTFWVYARDEQGHLVETDAPEFRVRHGLVPSAPPLPHSLSVEIISPSGIPILDAVFSKGTPLPTEKTVKYRATHDLNPNDPNSDLAIKLWEGEFLEDPGANDWIGNVLLLHNGVRRSIPEGAEIEVTLEVNASRLVSVVAFVPHLNQNFSGQLYLPQRDEQVFSNLSQGAGSETQEYRNRLEELERKSQYSGDEAIQSELIGLHRDLDELSVRATSFSNTAGQSDPDNARRIVEESRTIRGRIGRLEHRFANTEIPMDTTQFEMLVEQVKEVVGQFGAALEKQQLSLLCQELERVGSRGDDKAIKRVCEELNGLRWRILFKYDWFWKEVFDSLRDPTTVFENSAEAHELITKGQDMVVQGDGQGLREVVRALWNLQPIGNAEATRESAIHSGLRKY